MMILIDVFMGEKREGVLRRHMKATTTLPDLIVFTIIDKD
jgi:hypothetical protein